MYLGRTLAIAGIVYLSLHVISGYWYCADNFCPGDRESDWVYEYTDNDGKRYIVIDDKPILKDTFDQQLGIGKYFKENDGTK